jgi:pyridoxal phosphate enzyme (YggS family)
MSATAVPATLDAAQRLAAVRERMDAAARRAGRNPADVTLCAISKTFAPQQILPVVQAGQRVLGENRVQEAEEKVSELPGDVEWHLVGHLQSNKINKAIELFALIHSVDSLHLAEAISRRADHAGTPVRVLLQVNVAHKETQFGFDAAELRETAPALAALPGLRLDGLMCIAPAVEQAEETRPAFRGLADLYWELAPRMREGGHPWGHLSMGMSNDYPIAVEEGATLVRVGRAIFGERTPAAPAAVTPAARAS